MLTIKDGKKILTTPVSAEDLKDIHIGDVVYLNGDLTTCRPWRKPARCTSRLCARERKSACKRRS